MSLKKSRDKIKEDVIRYLSDSIYSCYINEYDHLYNDLELDVTDIDEITSHLIEDYEIDEDEITDYEIERLYFVEDIINLFDKKLS